MGVAANWALILADEHASLCLRSHPVIDPGVGGFGDSGSAAEGTVAQVFTILKKSGKTKDEGIHIEFLEVPFGGLHNADTVLHQLEGRLIRAIADALSQSHAGSEAR
jgi:hypothetical protein